MLGMTTSWLNAAGLPALSCASISTSGLVDAIGSWLLVPPKLVGCITGMGSKGALRLHCCRSYQYDIHMPPPDEVVNTSNTL